MSRGSMTLCPSISEDEHSYKLIVRTTQEPSAEKGNIFLFTAERVNEYNFFVSIDFLVIDEFYKLSGQRDDERSSSLNNAFYYLLKTFNPRFYLLGPNIDGISPGFEEAYNAIFYKSDYSLVDSREINIYEIYHGQFGDRGKKKEFIADDWSLLTTLDYDIGIHDGALQKHITTSIIDYFNSGQIKYLFCTSTIIEGVNTSAKNIVYFDECKGSNRIDFFDYSNIKGRAGRMMVHYVGKINNFNPPPEKSNIIIDIPFFQQDPIKDEVLIQLNENIIKDKNSEQYKNIAVIPQKEKEIIKRNGLSVQGQKHIIEILWECIHVQYGKIAWSSYPKYRELQFTLGLAWEHLVMPGETTSPMTKEKLVKMTFDYGYNKSVNLLVDNQFSYDRGLEKNKTKQDADLRDDAIQFVFQSMKHWFQYKVPKWLSVMNELQRFVCTEKRLKPGNYTYYANLIENDFLRENLAILLEYGVPSSAIRKLENYIPENVNQDDILNYIRSNRLNNHECLMQYEKEKITENL